MWRVEKERNINVEIAKSKELLLNNPMVIMRDKYTRKPLGISFSEEGLRTNANKAGIYPYCEGRVTDFNSARTARKSPNIIVERFIPKDNLTGKQLTEEILWINKAKHYIKGY